MSPFNSNGRKFSHPNLPGMFYMTIQNNKIFSTCVLLKEYEKKNPSFTIVTGNNMLNTSCTLI